VGVRQHRDVVADVTPGAVPDVSPRFFPSATSGRLFRPYPSGGGVAPKRRRGNVITEDPKMAGRERAASQSAVAAGVWPINADYREG
jgi:hypothetical protein